MAVININPAKASNIDVENIQKIRAAAYPSIGDQLDAILKIFLQMKTDGNDLPPDLDAIIDQWQAVKAQFPKPE